MNKVLNQSKEWRKLRIGLNNSYDFSADWDIAVGVFESRFLNHYMTPTDVLINLQNRIGEGFAIATIICGYIEALAAFKNGKVYNRRYKQGIDPSFEYSSSSSLYVRFLTTEDVFKDNFWSVGPTGDKLENHPFSAIDFYENVRCALVHEARTKNNWLINSRKDERLSSLVFIEEKNGEKSLMRSILQERMMDYLKEYIKCLKLNDLDGNVARRLFARKMDHLFEMDRDEATYEWWQVGDGD